MDIQLNIVIKNRIYREGIAAYFSTEKGIKTGVLSANASDALLKIKQSSPDIIVIDSYADELLANIRKIQLTKPQVKIILLLFIYEKEVVRRCVELGIQGIITNNDSLAELEQCIYSVSQGRLSYPCELASLLTNIKPIENRHRFDSLESELCLTCRQKNVLQLIAIGHSNKEIARKLNIQLPTVKNHVHQILERLNVKNRCEAAALYQQANRDVLKV